MLLYSPPSPSQCSRVQWTPPLRESFGFPLLALQTLALSRLLAACAQAHLHPPRLLVVLSIALPTCLFLLFWQVRWRLHARAPTRLDCLLCSRCAVLCSSRNSCCSRKCSRCSARSRCVCSATDCCSPFSPRTWCALPSAPRAVQCTHVCCAQMALSAAFVCLFGNRMLLASHYLSALLVGVALALLDRHLLRRRRYRALSALVVAVCLCELLNSSSQCLAQFLYQPAPRLLCRSSSSSRCSLPLFFSSG